MKRQLSNRRAQFTELFINAMSEDIARSEYIDNIHCGIDKLLTYLNDLKLSIIEHLNMFECYEEAYLLSRSEVEKFLPDFDLILLIKEIDKWRKTLSSDLVFKNTRLMERISGTIINCVFTVARDETIIATNITALSFKRGSFNLEKMVKLQDVKIFVVHGHNNAKYNELSNFLYRVGLTNHIRLIDQASGGHTIIEKFVEEASDSDIAIVLLTDDDIGYAKTEKSENASYRARQNVWFEAGYFYGSLGRNRTFLLKSEEVEFPSDILGVVYIDMKDSWQLKLYKELKKENIDINADNIF